MTILKKATLALILAASAAAGISATPAAAHENYRPDNGYHAYHAYYDDGRDRYDRRHRDYRNNDWNRRDHHRRDYERRRHGWQNDNYDRHDNYDRRGQYDQRHGY